MIETKLTAIDKITFTDTSFSIHFDSSSHLTDVASAHYAYGEVEKITFSDISSIQKIGNEDNIRLLISPNPVDDIIRIVGYNTTEPAQLSIYSLDGEEMMRIDNWQGEPIDASQLSAGIYILRINTHTIKFIKS
ncbi:MAG: T9SS type A sorting domain-containing protein [Muribaculaceae bacterium]|nr:T9SS type A sorting domain-containing protein [Muribaculaceae bacterium]